MFSLKYDIIKVELQQRGYYKSYGYLYIYENKDHHLFPALSGGYGRGSLPIGSYDVGSPVVLDDTIDNYAYKGDVFPWCCSLNPIGKCQDDQGKRTKLLIHPDGGMNGTLGCIGISKDDQKAYETMKFLFEKYNKREVRLDVC
jgi:hypothetical protein